ncbi:DMT family transporter [Catellatospora sichuanensis]|uniref:DMT family transporter n=1 Tax=Catellatospora sichuanensis TaxID=1969805 RepID=UPI0016428053|nr:DMT family transporter [Catellatospora sichuanensis]
MTTTVAAPAAVSTPQARSVRRGTVLVLVSATGFGMSAVFAKQAYAAGFNVPTMLAGRFALAAVLLWAVVAWRRAPLPRGRALAVCVGLGAVGYALQAGFYFGALARIDASLTALLLYAYPALVTVLAIALRRERPDRRRLAALACSAAGMLLMLGAGGVGGSVATGGVLLALGAAVAYALYLTVSAGLPAGLDIFAVTAVVCTSAAVSLAAAGLATGSLHTPHQASGWVWIVLLAVISTVVPIAGMFVGVRDVGASAAAILSCAEPAVTVATTVLVYGERLSPVQAAGGLAVLASVAVLQLRRRAPRRPLPSLAPQVLAAADPASDDVPAEPAAAAVRVGGRAVRRRLARRAPSGPAASTRPAADPVPNRRDQRTPQHPAQR